MKRLDHVNRFRKTELWLLLGKAGYAAPVAVGLAKLPQLHAFVGQRITTTRWRAFLCVAESLKDDALRDAGYIVVGVDYAQR